MSKFGKLKRKIGIEFSIYQKKGMEINVYHNFRGDFIHYTQEK